MPIQSGASSNGIREALSFLRQERRFLREELQHRGFLSRLLSPTPAEESALDRELEVRQHRIIRESAAQNQLGLYRNASLTLGCLQISRNDFDSALEYLMDVVFLDMNGATNSLPGHKSFDRQLADLLPFVSAIIRDVAATAGVDISSLEMSFKGRWDRFSSFGKPPYTPDSAWRKLKKQIAT
jgi:hypothetical protein